MESHQPIIDFPALPTDQTTRIDGRTPMKLREISISASILSNSSGSGMIQLGNTIVLASVYGPRGPSRANETMRSITSAYVKVELSFAPFNSALHSQHLSDTLEEHQTTIQQAIEATILLDRMPKSCISIYITVIQMDGSFVAAAIMAASIALMDAHIPLIDLVTAVTIIQSEDETIYLDPSEAEEQHLAVGTVTIAMMRIENKIVQLSQKGRILLENFNRIQRIGEKACGVLYDRIQGHMRENLVQAIHEQKSIQDRQDMETTVTEER